MVRVSRWWVQCGLAAALVVLPSATWADEPAPPVDPPSVRIQPPVGVTTQVRIQPPVGVTPLHRIQPPVGIAPERDRSLMELVMTWLRARISIPTG